MYPVLFTVASAVGAAIGGVATWAFFFAAWGKGGLSTDSVEFNNLLPSEQHRSGALCLPSVSLVSITTGVAADVHAVGVAQAGPLDDIILDNPVPAAYRGSGSAAQTVYSANIRDFTASRPTRAMPAAGWS